MFSFCSFPRRPPFLAGLLLGRLRAEQKLRKEGLSGKEKIQVNALFDQQKRLVVAVALVLNFGLLFVLKYYGFLSESLEAALRLALGSFSMPQIGILLPLGISFYIFQSAGYVIDVYRGKYEPDRNPFKFALFVWFFPQLVHGPIGRYDQLAHQLYQSRSFDADQLKYGLQLMLWGYFKKIIIADRAAVAVNQIFGNYADYVVLPFALGVLFIQHPDLL